MANQPPRKQEPREPRAFLWSELAQKIIDAESRIRPIVDETPLVASRIEGLDSRLWFKLESRQPTGSFKVRGALNFLLARGRDDIQRGCVAASTGNHGAAVAFAARHVGVPARVFVPEGSSVVKLLAIEQFGATVEIAGTDAVHAEAIAREFSRREGLPYISPYNDPEIIAGQGTIGVEIARQMSDVDTVFLALGGGGLVAGVGAYLKSFRPGIRIVGCSPENSAVMIASIRAGKIVEESGLPTLSDGTAGGLEEGSITFDLCRGICDEYFTVTEVEIRVAMKRFLGCEELGPLEGAAGVALAGFLKRRTEHDGGNCLVIICGANIDREQLEEVLASDL